ncbi:hypothetical protein ACIQW5_29265, partial [Methylorubrum thiocyanatum]|uniref:hypothetical protein n=1 Tax=Methylorubrum thiocyanatum TaxID=47958 RepID=UPI00383B4622
MYATASIKSLRAMENSPIAVPLPQGTVTDCVTTEQASSISSKISTDHHAELQHSGGVIFLFAPTPAPVKLDQCRNQQKSHLRMLLMNYIHSARAETDAAPSRHSDRVRYRICAEARASGTGLLDHERALVHGNKPQTDQKYRNH